MRQTACKGLQLHLTDLTKNYCSNVLLDLKTHSQDKRGHRYSDSNKMTRWVANLSSCNTAVTIFPSRRTEKQFIGQSACRSYRLAFKNAKMKIANRKTLLPTLLYGCESWSPTLRKERAWGFNSNATTRIPEPVEIKWKKTREKWTTTIFIIYLH